MGYTRPYELFISSMLIFTFCMRLASPIRHLIPSFGLVDGWWVMYGHLKTFRGRTGGRSIVGIGDMVMLSKWGGIWSYLVHRIYL